ncbi:hypothetical protein AcV7_009256 [Taiwanofungus camphoratus]|nr:hypothetical protein AcV7_009256 [Antrodia cinnamomea]
MPGKDLYTFRDFGEANGCSPVDRPMFIPHPIIAFFCIPHGPTSGERKRAEFICFIDFGHAPNGLHPTS